MAKLIKGALDLAEKAIGALDMSHQARMARAKEMGFDTDQTWYHGSPNQGEIDALQTGQDRGWRSNGNAYGDGVYMTTNPKTAAEYAGAGQVLPLTHGANLFEPSGLPISDDVAAALDRWVSGLNDADLARLAMDIGTERKVLSFSNADEAKDFYKTHLDNWEYFGGVTKTKPQVKKIGDGFEIEYTDFNAPPTFRGKTGNEAINATLSVSGKGTGEAFSAAGFDGIKYLPDEAVIFNPSNIRSVNAAFDPTKKDSSNLLASLAGAGVLTGAMLPSEDAEAGVISQALKAKYPEVSFWLSERGDKSVLDKVVIPDELRNQGLGSQFMQDLTEMASKEGKTLALTPSSDFGGSKARLEEFYRRFGFIPNKGKNKDYEIRETMYRLPAVAGAGVLGAGALAPGDAQAAPSIESQIANNYGALHASDPLPPPRELPASLANAALETMAGVNRGVTEAVDFATVDQLNAILELMGVDWRAPNLTGALSPATQGNFLKPGTHRDSARALGELLSPSPI